MNETRYNKQVRGRIPEIVKAGSKTCVTEILPDEQYLADAGCQAERGAGRVPGE